MSTDILKLWAEDSYCTVVGRECFVELRHAPADCRILLHEINFVPHVRKVQRSLHAAYAAAYDKYGILFGSVIFSQFLNLTPAVNFLVI